MRRRKLKKGESSEYDSSSESLPGPKKQKLSFRFIEDETKNRGYTNIVEGSILYEYYGFLLYLTSGIAFIAYIVWAYVPDDFIRSSGFAYYPSKYWAVALPALFCIFCIYLFLLGLGYQLASTPFLDSPYYLSDQHSVVSLHPRFVALDQTSEIHDLSMNLVNKCIYPKPE